MQPINAWFGFIPSVDCCQGNIFQPCSLSTLQKRFTSAFHVVLRLCTPFFRMQQKKLVRFPATTINAICARCWFSIQKRLQKLKFPVWPNKLRKIATLWNYLVGKKTGVRALLHRRPLPGWQLSVMLLSGRKEDFWEVSLWAGEAHWEVFLSALEQLFRQLVSRRTVQLSSYQLVTPLLPSPILFLSVSFSRSSFVHWPVSWRLSDGCGWRMEVSQERSLMNALYAKGPASYSAPNVPTIISALPFVVICAHLNASQELSGGGRSWKLPEQLIYASYWLSWTADYSYTTQH